MSKSKTMQSYAEMMAVVTAALVKALDAGVTRESVIAALNELVRLLEEE